jgi:hypothetical protein
LLKHTPHFKQWNHSLWAWWEHFEYGRGAVWPVWFQQSSYQLKFCGGQTSDLHTDIKVIFCDSFYRPKWRVYNFNFLLFCRIFDAFNAFPQP